MTCLDAGRLHVQKDDRGAGDGANQHNQAGRPYRRGRGEDWGRSDRGGHHSGEDLYIYIYSEINVTVILSLPQ
jgi:hypothetical protein